MDCLLKLLAPRGALLTHKGGLAYLKPTTISELKTLCPAWSICRFGSVVVMSRRRTIREWLIGGR